MNPESTILALMEKSKSCEYVFRWKICNPQKNAKSNEVLLEYMQMHQNLYNLGKAQF